jgi:excisionase family DNA binding protein
VAERAIAPPENWRLKGLNIQLALRNKNPELSAVASVVRPLRFGGAAMTTRSSCLSKPLCMSEGSGTLAKKNPEPPPAQGYLINNLAKAVGIGRTTIYKLIAEGKIRPVKTAGRVLIPVPEIAHSCAKRGRPNDIAPNANARPRANAGSRPEVVREETSHTIAHAEPEADFVIDLARRFGHGGAYRDQSPGPKTRAQPPDNSQDTCAG